MAARRGHVQGNARDVSDGARRRSPRSRSRWPNPPCLRHCARERRLRHDLRYGRPAESATQYLSQTLPGQGVLLSQYYGTGHVSLDNYIAMISGQSSTVQTHVDCTFYDDFKLTGVTPDGQAIGTGCVYPAQFKTLADQLTASGRTWRGYMEDMGLNPKREQTTCGQPLDPQGKVALNELDDTQGAETH